MTDELPKRTCKNKRCGIEFQPTVPRMVYHNRKCFKDAWKRKQRSTGMPKFRCPKCKKVSQLEFNPKATLAFYKWSCKCGFKPL